MTVCAWCDKPAVSELVVEPERPGTRAKGWRDYRQAKTAPACAEHMSRAMRVERPRRRARPKVLKGQMTIDELLEG